MLRVGARFVLGALNNKEKEERTMNQRKKVFIMLAIWGLTGAISVARLEGRTPNDSNRYLDGRSISELDEVLPPERKKVSEEVLPSIAEPFILALYDLETPQNKGGWQGFRALAAGKYDEAIQTAINGLNENAPWNEDVGERASSGRAYYMYLNILAVAYELNGDWTKALNAYASLHGEKSEEFLWAQARIFYATGNKQSAFKAICDAILQNLHLSIDLTIKKLTESDEKRNRVMRTFGIYSERGAPDAEWFALWKLRDQCARVVMPELHYVVNAGASNNENGDFNLAQKDAFERFLLFFEEEFRCCSNEDCDVYNYRRCESQYLLVKELAKLPYARGQIGMGTFPF